MDVENPDWFINFADGSRVEIPSDSSSTGEYAEFARQLLFHEGVSLDAKAITGALLSIQSVLGRIEEGLFVEEEYKGAMADIRRAIYDTGP
jgi:hypothetical protein